VLRDEARHRGQLAEALGELSRGIHRSGHHTASPLVAVAAVRLLLLLPGLLQHVPSRLVHSLLLVQPPLLLLLLLVLPVMLLPRHSVADRVVRRLRAPAVVTAATTVEPERRGEHLCPTREACARIVSLQYLRLPVRLRGRQLLLLLLEVLRQDGPCGSAAGDPSAAGAGR